VKIIRSARFHDSVTYHRSFHYEGEPGSGFGFDCDEQGTVDLEALAPAGLANYNRCLRGSTDDGLVIIDAGVERREHHWREPAVGRCDCGREVDLGGFTNTCECGADYNSAGQLLAPRSHWGEETGETAADIMMGGW
jgi:hypothetical protein